MNLGRTSHDSIFQSKTDVSRIARMFSIGRSGDSASGDSASGDSASADRTYLTYVTTGLSLTSKYSGNGDTIPADYILFGTTFIRRP